MIKYPEYCGKFSIYNGSEMYGKEMIYIRRNQGEYADAVALPVDRFNKLMGEIFELIKKDAYAGCDEKVKDISPHITLRNDFGIKG